MKWTDEEIIILKRDYPTKHWNIPELLKRHPKRGIISKSYGLKVKAHDDWRVGENHHLWKGDNVRYRGLHRWLRKTKPKPNFCENCHKKKNYYQIANISGEYKRDVNDYLWLCHRCHCIMDGTVRNFKREKQLKELKKQKQ